MNRSMKQLTPEALHDWIKSGKKFSLVDVREDWEHQSYNIGGIHIPLNEIISRKAEIDTDLPAVIYCEKGIRSLIAIQRLESYGFKDLYNLQGGMSAWKKQLP